MNEKQLDKTLMELVKDHRLWYETIGKEGSRLDSAGYDISRADLSRAYYFDYWLDEAKSNGAYLSITYLTEAHCFNACIHRAYLSGVRLKAATDLNEFELYDVTIDSDLYKADLDRAVLLGAIE